MTQMPLPLTQPHRNQQLFSDYYLNVLLPQRPDWKLLAADARAAIHDIRAIFDRYTPSNNEAQTEDGLIKPVLHALGHTFEVQAALQTPDGTKKPDYVLYRDQMALVANKGVVLHESVLQGRAIAVGDAKYWDRPLDVAIKTGADPFSNKNPSYQIAFYVQHSGVEWGILTNGRLWRLYHSDTAHKLDRFYEVDLPALLQADDPAHFLYFYAFFHRSAFDDHPLSLHQLLRASRDYARGVGDTLKGQVYEALRHLAQGFLDYAPNRLQADPPTLHDIYDHALIVLYRLLFVLYAEARDLLPLRDSLDYRESYSLRAITRDVARALDGGRPLRPNSAVLWQRLRELFRMIDQGDEPLKVATFNGGLFDPDQHPFLEQYAVGDARLQHALDLLARVKGEFVDYRDLAERHLGTIYEGLLEYHLEAILPEGAWSLALVNDNGERKATGSYYTPDWIVKYIVDHTLGPLLRSAVASAADDRAKIAAVLNVNVLDPSMGSGHFLVEATEYIARFLVDLAVTPDTDAGGEADVQYWKRRVAQSCIYGVDLNPLAVDLAKLSLWLSTVAKGKPLSFLDHHLRAGNALVGARIGALDVRPGVNKKAARKSAAARAAGQVSLLDDDAFRQSMSSAVGSMGLIEGSAADNVDEVHEQERLYTQLHDNLTRTYAKLADLATSLRFGVPIDPALWQPLTAFAAGKTLAPLPRFEEWLQQAAAIAAEQHFFHWDIEFPEIFFDQHGAPLGHHAGFDAVIGNPPYVRQEALGPLKPYFADTYADTYHGAADLYVYFYHQGLRLLQAGGRMAYIVTNKWLRAGYGEPLRGYFAAQGALEQIIDFGHAPIFPDADVFPCIVVLHKPDTNDGHERQVDVAAFPREALGTISLDHFVQTRSHRVPHSRFGSAAWSLETSDIDDLMAKIKRVGVPLYEYAGVKPYRGVLTGFNEAFLIDTPTKERLIREDPRSAEIIKPYLRGQDIKRWSPEWAGLWMTVLKSSSDHQWPWSNAGDDAERIFEQTFPALHAHLKPYEAQLRKRQDKGRFWWELRSCAYYAAFDRPKLIHTDITWRSQFALVTEPMYLLNTAYMWPLHDSYTLAALNSPLLWSFMWRNAMHGKDEALRLIYSFVETIPIAPPSDTIRAEVEPAVECLVTIQRANQEARRDLLDWLRTEFEIETPGQKLHDFAALDAEAFVDEVRKRRPKTAGRLTSTALRDLRSNFAELATPMQQRRAEADALEQRLADLVNAAYGLTADEIDLLWRTAPPRMPVGRPVHLQNNMDGDGARAC